MALDIHLLGPPEVLRDENPLPLSGHRPLALLAYLVVTGKAHTRTHLTDLLFASSADPRAGLRWTLSKLRQAVGPEFFLATREQVAFNDQASYSCDVDALLDGDLSVVRGVFLEGLHVSQAPLFEEWQLITAQQLRQSYQDGLLGRIARHERLSEHQEVVDLAARLVQMDNLREEWRRLLMRAYAAIGDWDAALEQYEQCRQLLAEELATTPAKETVDLWHQLRRRKSVVTSQPGTSQFPTDVGTAADPSRSLKAGPPGKMPFFRTSFVGREAEIREIQTTLAEPDCRLLTVVGPGGIGKTRLAVHAAINLERHFEHGIYFVSLRQVAAADGLASAIARSLGLTAYSDRVLREQLVTYVRHRSILLLLDNMEHLLVSPDWDAGEALLAEMIAGAPRLRMLATSRERLHMPEEWLYTLGGLTFAPVQSEIQNKTAGDLRDYAATQLFLQRARQIDSAYHPDRVRIEDLRAIAAICRRTAGMPLALEMAAAWVDHVPCVEIAASLNDDLAILTKPGAQGPDRHASMHAVFEHSWQLLGLDLRRLLAQLSVLRGRFDREAAAAIADGSLFSLSALLDKSLLEATGDGRYQVHELLRQFAAEKLAKDVALAPATRKAHSIYYCRLCHTLEQDLKGGAQTRAAERMQDSLGNIRAAFAWTVEQSEWTRLANASFSLGYFCRLHGHIEEGRAIFRGVTDVLNKNHLSANEAIAGARASYWLGQLSDGSDAVPFWRQATSYFETARRLGSGSDSDEALFTEALASASHLVGDYAEQGRHYQAALVAARRADDIWIEARTLNAYAGLQVWTWAHYQDAWKNAGEALRLQRTINDRTGMVETLGTLSAVDTFLRHYAQAIQHSEEALTISQVLGNDLRTAIAHRHVSWALLLVARFDECIIHLRHAYAIYTHYGQDRLVAETLQSLAWRSCMGDHYDDAHRYADELDTLLAGKAGHRIVRAFLICIRSLIAFHEERFAAALELAQESIRALMPIGEHNQVASVRTILGFSYLALNDLESATIEAKLFLSQGTMPGLWGLSVVALVLVWQDPCEEHHVQFYELLALQSAATPLWDSPSYRKIIRRLQPPGLAEFSPEQRAEAEARGRFLDPDTTIAALREQFEEYGQ